MTAKKTTTPSKNSPEKPAKASPKSSQKPKRSKPDPVVLDPPSEKAAAAKTQKPEVVDAQVVEVQESKPKPDPSIPPEEKPAGDSQRKSGAAGFVALVAGGIVAAGIGYVAAVYINPPPPPNNTIEKLQTLSGEYSEKIAGLEARIDQLENSPTAKLEKDLAALNESLAQQSRNASQKIAELEADLSNRLSDLENAGDQLTSALDISGSEISEASAALIAKYGAEIDAIKQQIADQLSDREKLEQRLDEVANKANQQLSAAQSKVEELSQEIASKAQTIDLDATRERLRSALETGKSYAKELAELAKEAEISIPDILSEKSETGLPTLADLQQSFPSVARRALKASVKAEAGDGIGARLGAFLKSQLGARSLEEKEGDDPDAVLSRAEAALKRGDLSDTIDLVRQLPPEGISEFSDWLKNAEERLAATAALDDLDKTLDGSD